MKKQRRGLNRYKVLQDGLEIQRPSNNTTGNLKQKKNSWTSYTGTPSMGWRLTIYKLCSHISANFYLPRIPTLRTRTRSQGSDLAKGPFRSHFFLCLVALRLASLAAASFALKTLYQPSSIVLWSSTLRSWNLQAKECVDGEPSVSAIHQVERNIPSTAMYSSIICMANGGT